MPTVAVLGTLTVDHLVQVGTGARFDVLGGPGLYGALGARLVEGASVVLLTELPADEPRFADLLDSNGIDRSHCPVVGTAPRLWILDSPQGRRIAPTAPEGGIELMDGQTDSDGQQLDSVPAAAGEADAALLCAPTCIPSSLPERMLIGVDPEQRLVAQRGVDYWSSIVPPRGILLPSRVQLRNLADDPRTAARTLAATLGASVVARLDRDGALAVDPEGHAWSVVDSDVKVTDTTGAGDAMAGATVAALAAGYPLEEAAALGVSAARLVLEGWGAEGLSGRSPLRNPLPGISIKEN
jgi:sugar/nucleoside kinase (ribokinase family)